MKLLIHACCAPCLTYVHQQLKDDDVTVYWFNPNIHPYREYQQRLHSMERYADLNNISVVYSKDYLLKEFLCGAMEAKNRCEFCYEWRLNSTADYASKNGYDAFTTTLCISPYQDQDLIRAIGENAAKKFGSRFMYRDMRNEFRESKRMAREKELYMQKYCGCIFSEEERYRS